MLSSANQPQIGSGSLPRMLLHTFWTVIQNLTGAFGVTPQEVGLVIAALLVIGLLTQFYAAFKNKTSFTLDAPKE